MGEHGGPGWFEEALAQSPERATTQVEGAAIASLAWGDRSDPTMVVVHGGAAHANWWGAIGPILATDHRVVAIDLSGHGDSAHRAVYRSEQWAREILAVAAAQGGTGRPLVVGHSMGGFVTIVVAAIHGAEVAGAIVLDAPVRRPDPESAEGRGGRMFRSPKTYPDLATGMEHFHLVPPQPCDNTWLLEHVARTSLREGPDGWSWKFDPKVFTAREGPARPSDFGPQLAQASCRIALVNGARSAIVDDDVRAYMTELLAGSPAAAAGIPVVDIPDAHHHLLLDQPLATVTAIRGFVAAWHPIGAEPPTVPVS
ncbi:MAG: alpha/beta hydrolase [Nitriliruptoraceae bacterium]|nr:alpha/beta hydrolase [Nitriliruptoraceae bacterium]